jgi:hypothetical protein
MHLAIEVGDVKIAKAGRLLLRQCAVKRFWSDAFQ